MLYRALKRLRFLLRDIINHRTSSYCLPFRRHSSTIVTKGIDMNIIQKMKSLWGAIYIIDNDAINDLNETLEHMQSLSLSKEDKKLIGKSLKKQRGTRNQTFLTEADLTKNNKAYALFKITKPIYICKLGSFLFGRGFRMITEPIVV